MCQLTTLKAWPTRYPCLKQTWRLKSIDLVARWSSVQGVTLAPSWVVGIRSIMNWRATLKSSTMDVSKKPYPGKVEKKLKAREFFCPTVTTCKKRADVRSKSAKLCKTQAILDEIKAFFTGNTSRKIILLPLVVARGLRCSQASTILNNLIQFRVPRWWPLSLTSNQKQKPNNTRWTSSIANTWRVNMTITAI